MAQYTKVFADPYPNGWKAKPDLSTPYTTTIRNNHDATLRNIEQYLYDNPIGDISQASIGSLKDVNLKYGYYDDKDHWDIGHVLKVKSYYDEKTQTNVLGFVPVALDVINDLSDVSIAAADKVDGNVLTYDDASGKLKLKAPSGGGGISYSTTEKVVGTDENGNTIYSKTSIELPWEGETEITPGSFQIISTKHRILKVEASVYFLVNGQIQQLNMPYSSKDVYQRSGIYTMDIWADYNIYYNNQSSSVPWINFDWQYIYNNTEYSANKLRYTVYYIKETT